MKLSKASRFLLQYLADLHPRGIGMTTPIQGAQFDERPKMTNVNGLIRRGWVREAIEGNKPFGRGIGIYYITESGLQANSNLQNEKSK